MQAGSRVSPTRWLLAALLLGAACAPAAPASRPAPPAAASPTQAPAAAPAAPAPSDKPLLVTVPPVNVKVGVLPSGSYGAHFVAQHRGYFREVGIDVEFTTGSNVNQLLPAISQGQLHVGSCSNSIGCFNAMNRRVDMRVVADLSSGASPSPKSDSSGLVVRKDLWDAAVIREPKDLIGRQLYNIAGEGSGHHAMAARWLRTKGIDPRGLEWPQMTFPDILAAMQNRGIEVAVQSEPLLTAGESMGVYVRMAAVREMHPTAHLSYLMYHASIEGLGPQVGERFLVALLRGGRDYVNAMEYGVDQDAIIAILTQETFQKDPEVYKRTGYSWMDPNGVVSLESLQADADLFYELGVAKERVDLSGMGDDRYRQFAVQYLGEYRPPQ